MKSLLVAGLAMIAIALIYRANHPIAPAEEFTPMHRATSGSDEKLFAHKEYPILDDLQLKTPEYSSDYSMDSLEMNWQSSPETISVFVKDGNTLYSFGLKTEAEMLAFMELNKLKHWRNKKGRLMTKLVTGQRLHMVYEPL